MIKHEAATDSPGALWYRRVYEEFPKCKFIYTYRQRLDWIDSMARDFGKPARPEYRHFRMLLFGQELFETTRWANVDFQHLTEVQYFKMLHHDFQLQYMDICTGDGWPHLCEFLNKPVPDVPFPWENKWKPK